MERMNIVEVENQIVALLATKKKMEDLLDAIKQSIDCPLCNVYRADHGRVCGLCPVKEHIGSDLCLNWDSFNRFAGAREQIELSAKLFIRLINDRVKELEYEYKLELRQHALLQQKYIQQHKFSLFKAKALALGTKTIRVAHYFDKHYRDVTQDDIDKYNKFKFGYVKNEQKDTT